MIFRTFKNVNFYSLTLATYYHKKGYFGVRKALFSRNGLHLQLNPGTLEVSLLNTLSGAYEEQLNLVCNIFDLSGQSIGSQNYSVSMIEGNTVRSFPPIVWPSKATKDDVYLFILSLYPASSVEAVEERNYYWLSDPSNQFPNYTQLAHMRDDINGPLLEVSACGHVNGRVLKVDVSLENLESVIPGELNVAFMVTFSLHYSTIAQVYKESDSRNKESDDDRVLPSFYGDNYLIILPGETVSSFVEHDYETPDTESKEIDWGSYYLSVEGWNVPSHTYEIKAC